MNVMKEFYLIVGARINPSGWQDGRTTIRTTTTAPSLAKHEVAMKIKLELPKALFQRPQLTAKISVSEEVAPLEITPDIQDTIAESIKEATGMNITLEVVKTTGGDE